ncbi:LPS assembly lipoprotein LptE [Haliea sp. E17]|uniref:LPS-assembly lipoprotein LptE n=1 Tax=Haliea sp. E17 TaxID=3401576 RepID=UPI003AAE0936
MSPTDLTGIPMLRHTATATLLFLTLFLGACGFHLRGTGEGITVADEWRSMYLDTGNPNSEFSREIRARFAANGIVWADKREDANYTLILGPERFSQKNLSLNAEARAAEFELTLASTFSVRDDKGKQVMPNANASVLKQMENDPRNVVGKAEEIRILRAEMRTELAQQIMRRIAFFAASQDA